MSACRILKCFIFVALTMLPTLASAEFYLKWQVPHPTYPVFASYFQSSNTNGNAVREEPFGAMTDGLISFVFVTGANGANARMIDLSTGSVYGITGLDALPFDALTLPHVHVRYSDLDNDGQDEVLLSCTNWGLGCIDWQGPSPTVDPGTQLNGRSLQAYPNPTNDRAVISFDLTHDAKVELRLYDAAGRLVRTLVSGALRAGSHQLEWNGRSNADEALPSGTYFYQLLVDDKELESRKAVIIR